MELMHSARHVRFEEAILPHLDAAHNLARWLLGNRPDAEDAVQEACLRALTYFHTFQGGDGRAWLLAIVRNHCFEWLRKSRYSLEFPVENLQLARDERLGPEALQLQLGDQAAVQRGLESLSPEFREVLVLREMEGMSYREIAEVINVPPGTVMSRLARARRRLQQVLTASARKEETA